LVTQAPPTHAAIESFTGLSALQLTHDDPQKPTLESATQVVSPGHR